MISRNKTTCGLFRASLPVLP